MLSNLVSGYPIHPYISMKNTKTMQRLAIFYVGFVQKFNISSAIFLTTAGEKIKNR